MFAEVKELLTFISGDDYDGKIVAEINACALDLTTSAEIVLPGKIEVTRTHEAATTSEPERWVITDNSTITDKQVMTAMITYCRAHFGSPADYEKMAASYELQRRQLANADGYTSFTGGDGT